MIVFQLFFVFSCFPTISLKMWHPLRKVSGAQAPCGYDTELLGGCAPEVEELRRLAFTLRPVLFLGCEGRACVLGCWAYRTHRRIHYLWRHWMVKQQRSIDRHYNPAESLPD
eukprot:EG_transcript_7058